jgi:hypothetical protein
MKLFSWLSEFTPPVYVLPEKFSALEVKQFYREHSTDVFYVVYGSFNALETNIQEKCETTPTLLLLGNANVSACSAKGEGHWGCAAQGAH